MILKVKYIFYTLLALNVGVLLYYFNQRDAFHTDEFWSYAHANSTQGAYLSPNIDSFMKDKNNDITYKWLEGKVFHDYLTVQPEERFHYGQIWENLQKGVHPPLFYVLLHTICSFFPDLFNKWYGGVVNILFFALTLIMLYKLSKFVLRDDVLALMPVFLWGFSNVGIGTAMYLRMYMLQTFFAVWLMYETLLLLSLNKVCFKRLSLIFLASFLGIFTQYNSLLFSFVLAACSCLVLLRRKNWQLLCVYGVTMLLSTGALFLLFPAAYDVLFHSSRGVQVREILENENFSVLWWLLHLERPIETYFTALLSFSEIHQAVLVIMVIFIFMAICNREKNREVGLVLFVTLSLLVAMAYLMPKMWLFWQRYVMFLMPFAALLTVYLIILGGVYITLPKKWIAVCCGGIVLINSLAADFGNHSVFAFRYKEKVGETFSLLQDKRIFVVSTVPTFLSGTSLYMNNEKVFRVVDVCDNLEERKQADYVLRFKSVVQDIGMYNNIRSDEVIEDACMADLEYVARLPLTFDLMFDLYKVLK